MSPTALPPDVTYGWVADRVLRAVMDTTRDADRYPDGVPARGTVTFVPVQKVMAAGGGKTTVVQEEYSFHIHQGDAEPDGTELPDGDTKSDLKGLLVNDLTGAVAPHPLIVGWYDVTYRLESGTVQRARVHVTEEYTENNPMWVREHAAITPSPVEKFVVNEAVYTETLAARTQAVTAAAEALAVLEGTVVDLDIDPAGHLIATLHDATVVDLGMVRGDQGLPGDLTPAALAGAWSGSVSIPSSWLPSTRIVTLTGDTILALPTPPVGVSGTITLLISQNGTGGHTLEVPGAITAWGVAPVPTPDPNAADVWHLLWTGAGWVLMVGATNVQQVPDA